MMLPAGIQSVCSVVTTSFLPMKSTSAFHQLRTRYESAGQDPALRYEERLTCDPSLQGGP